MHGDKKKDDKLHAGHAEYFVKSPHLARPPRQRGCVELRDRGADRPNSKLSELFLVFDAAISFSLYKAVFSGNLKRKPLRRAQTHAGACGGAVGCCCDRYLYLNEKIYSYHNAVFIGKRCFFMQKYNAFNAFADDE